jgi:hypothetical protein
MHAACCCAMVRPRQQRLRCRLMDVSHSPATTTRDTLTRPSSCSVFGTMLRQTAISRSHYKCMCNRNQTAKLQVKLVSQLLLATCLITYPVATRTVELAATIPKQAVRAELTCDQGHGKGSRTWDTHCYSPQVRRPMLYCSSRLHSGKI